MDRVFLTDLRVSGKHGYFERERRVEQEFGISVSAALDTRAAGNSDALEDTADYLRFERIVEEAVAGESCYLIERLAERIAAGILEDKKITEVSVTIRKPAVLKNGTPGVTIVRRNS